MFYEDDYDERDEEDREIIPAILTPRDVMYHLYVGRNTFYKLVNSGELKAFRVGKLWRVRREDILGFHNS